MTQTTGRDILGKFLPGRVPSDDEKIKKAEGIKRYYESFVPSARLREQNPYIFNAWRAMWYNDKGKKVGCTTEEWKVFENFFADVSPTYKKGYKFHRIDTTAPFSRENYMWMTPEQAALLGRGKALIYLEYKGEKLTIKEWALKYNLSANGIAKRYHSSKGSLPVETILLGKKIARGTKQPKDAVPGSQKERDKASRMLSTYRCLDKQRGFAVCDIDIDWMIENIMHKPCIYCGDTHRVGCDRVDNNKGHTKDNVVPCCCECNSVRNNYFSYEEMQRLGQVIKQIKEERK